MSLQAPLNTQQRVTIVLLLVAACIAGYLFGTWING